MPEETIETPDELSHVSDDDAKQVGSVSVDAAASDPAGPIHREFPSVSPRPAEFEFHQERFDRMAERFRDRGVLKKLIDWRKGIAWNAEMEPEDFAHQEALRDDAYFERKKDEEFQAWQKNLQVVIEHLKEKQDPANPEGQKRKILLLVMGGGMKGPYSAGQVLGLNAIGMGEDFDTIVGISAGAGTAAYFTAGPEQTRLGASLFYEECTTKDFIDMRRVRQIMDVDFVIDRLREGEKKLDQQAIMDSDKELYVVATDAETLESSLINAKTAKPDMLSALHASMSAPIVYREAVEVNGGKYIDGAFDPMPIKKIIDELQPTDILILPNTPFDRMDSFETTPGEYFFSELLQAASKIAPLASLGRDLAPLGSLGTVEKFLSAKQQIRKSLEFIQKQTGVSIGILWPPDSGLTNVGTNPDAVQAAELESARGTIEAFGEPQPHEIKLYHHKEPMSAGI
ncbi:MAG TPA: patatin-like phospholipase family protein [Candidatus Binatia bacterium]|nr:patatin-like phospholipase family protein [Candidatus Binatia bacterium]